jgi:hypothetical protein
MRALLLFLSLLLPLLPLAALAHASSQAYLDLRPAGDGVLLRADVALRDLDELLDLDADADGMLRWGELRRAAPAIAAALRQGLRLRGCDAAWTSEPLQLERRADGVYAALRFSIPCAMPREAPLRYSLLGELDPTHRALLRWTPQPGAAPKLALLHPLQPPIWNTEEPKPEPMMKALAPAALMTLAPAAAQADAGAPSFAWEGVVHLVTGYDHLLFLLCLLLPAVLARRVGLWHPVAHWRDALLPVAGVVTAFTVAHSITLALAALGHVRISPAVIEPLIAASIVLAAIDNLWPILRNTPRWAVAFGFGLVHGFGFAGVLGELDLPAGELAWALLQFNLGLEAAQLAVVAIAVALLWQLRRWHGYPRWVLGLGSGGAALIGAFWVVQRVA